MSEAFVSVLEKHKGREWPNVEQFVAAVDRPERKDAGDDSGDRSRLSKEQARILDEVILPRARKWLGTGLHEHGVKTLEFWGERA